MHFNRVVLPLCVESSSVRGFERVCARAQRAEERPRARVPLYARARARSFWLRSSVCRTRARSSCIGLVANRPGAHTSAQRDTMLRMDLTRNTSLDQLRGHSPLNPHAQLAILKANSAVPSFSMYVHDPSECKWISKSLLTHGRFEAGLIAAVVKALAQNPGEWFLDIGANFGVYALSAAAAGFYTMAVEPLHYNTELLAASAAHAGIGHRMMAFKTAVAAHRSDEAMCVISHERTGAGNKGNGQLAPLRDCSQAADSARSSSSRSAAIELVPVNTIDNLIASEPALLRACFAAVKVDVEGFELPAMLGAGSVFGGRCPPCLVVIEYVPYYNVSLLAHSNQTRNPLPFLSSLGYKCRREQSRHYRCENMLAARCRPSARRGGHAMKIV